MNILKKGNAKLKEIKSIVKLIKKSNPKDFADELKAIKERKAQKKSNQEQKIKAVADATGWSYDYAKKQMLSAKERTGAKFSDYIKYRLYEIPEEQQAEYFKKYLERNNRMADKKHKKNEKFIHIVMDATGWNYDKAKAEMDRSKRLCGAEYKDYASYEFWRLSKEKQATYFTKGNANALSAKYNTSIENKACFKNKDQFNRAFSKYLGRPWLCTKEMNFKQFQVKFSNQPKVIYKPLSASCGAGITVKDINEYNLVDIYKQLKKLPAGVVEGYIVQHPEMSKYSKNSVNTVRLVTVYDGNEVYPVYGAFRMGGGDAIVDNFHNGGVLAIIDVANGSLVTNAIDLNGRFYERHPATNEKFLGFTIPYWDKVIEMITEAGKVVEGVGYVGWDIAITETGPVLIEGNTAPAPNVLQLPYSKEDKGMKYVIERFL